MRLEVVEKPNNSLKREKMKNILKTTTAITLAAMLLTGCGEEDFIKPANTVSSFDASDYLSDSVDTSGSTSTQSGQDSFNISKAPNGFKISWNKSYEGYAEIIYQKVGTDRTRGDGYPFTNNATGSYTLTCEKTSDETDSVRYSCSRSDITLTSNVTLQKGVQYEWLVSYGFDHEHSEPTVTMEYVSDTLTIE